jgi:hypothetical protein
LRGVTPKKSRHRFAGAALNGTAKKLYKARILARMQVAYSPEHNMQLSTAKMQFLNTCQ